MAFGMQGSLLSRFRDQLAGFYRTFCAGSGSASLWSKRTPNIAMLAFDLTVLTVVRAISCFSRLDPGGLTCLLLHSPGRPELFRRQHDLVDALFHSCEFGAATY